ncbi:hypothetical protein HPB49_021688 [Dermacentor silvarum]|uniref:Uncharacterized protein n=1 Tax=Dermacentor silvarum TaxID=543639 RepID=A0ACB8D837_DERSI|nr:hypothetical protein HPB49_021688 [Dermacentor silvarum]
MELTLLCVTVQNKQGNKDAAVDSKGHKQQKQKEKLSKDQAAAQEKRSKYAKGADKAKQDKEPKLQQQKEAQLDDKEPAQQPEPAKYHKQDEQRTAEQPQQAAKNLCAESRSQQPGSATKCQTDAQQATVTQAAAPAAAAAAAGVGPSPVCPQSKTSMGHGCVQSCACPDTAVCFAATGNTRGVCKLPEPDDLTRGSYLP